LYTISGREGIKEATQLDGLTVFFLFAIIVVIGLILVYFLRGSLDSNDSHRIDQLPDDHDSFINPRDPSHDEKL
jgi:hypothetical protein